jgi:DNA polymerase-3 subunit epsilon
VFLDLEMTGLRPESDRVIEVCAVRVRGDVVEGRVDTLVRPACGRHGNEHVHGITRDDLASAPTFDAIAGSVVDLMEGAIPVAHAASWDVAFLEAELARAGRVKTFPHYLDTLTLTRRAWSLPSHSLASLCDAFGIVRARAHRAHDDVAALRTVYARVAEALAPTTPRDLWHVRVGKRVARPDIVAAALLAAETGAVVTVRYRPARHGPEQLRFHVTAVRTDLDPPRVLGYLDASRSRRELRADRILAIAADPPSPGAPAIAR